MSAPERSFSCYAGGRAALMELAHRCAARAVKCRRRHNGLAVAWLVFSLGYSACVILNPRAAGHWIDIGEAAWFLGFACCSLRCGAYAYRRGMKQREEIIDQVAELDAIFRRQGGG